MSIYQKDNVIVNLTFEFSLNIIRFCDRLQESKRYHMADQLWRSGTAVGALVIESQNAESKADFIHKMKVAGKEGDETLYWLRLCELSEGYPFDDKLTDQITSINKIINRIIATSKTNNKHQ